eukprot:1139617-Pelagomonas_calceolata.AAC.10
MTLINHALIVSSSTTGVQAHLGQHACCLASSLTANAAFPATGVPSLLNAHLGQLACVLGIIRGKEGVGFSFGPRTPCAPNTVNVVLHACAGTTENSAANKAQ